MTRNNKAVSTAVASIAALATVLAISALASAILLGRASSTTLAAAERLSQGEKKIPVRLSTVYHVPPVIMLSNDGTRPVKITKLYLDGQAHPIQAVVLGPGERAEFVVGFSEKVAVDVDGYGAVVVETVKRPVPPAGGAGGGLQVDFRCSFSRSVMPVYFQALAYGGQPPYSFTLYFGDGGSETYLGHVLLTQRFYSTLPVTATVTVRDQNGTTSSSSLRVSLGGDNQCSGVPPP
ncbi:MAG: hypothetical protein QXU87_02370 [Candidatus Caldarchaeum sp.]